MDSNQSSSVHGPGGIQCVKCGYDLAGTPLGGQCPECGTDIITSMRAQNAPTSGKAIAAMVVGICSIVVGCMSYGVVSIACGPVAIVLAVKARRDIETGRFSPSSRGMATAGLVTGIIGCVLGGLAVLLIILFLAGAVMSGPVPVP